MTGLFDTRPALQFALGLVIIGIVAIVTSGWIVEGRLAETALVWSLAVGLTMLSYPRFLLGVALATISLPMFLLRPSLTLSNLAAAGLLVIIALGFVRNRAAWNVGLLQVLGILYLANLAVIAQVRGFGFLVAGGDSAGAMSYLRILLAIVPIFAVAWYPLAERHWKHVLLFLGAGSLLYVVADLCYAYNVGTNVIRFFLAGSGMRPGEAALMQAAGEGVFRLSGAKETAIWLSIMLVALARPEQLFGVRAWVFAPILAVIVLLAAVSGFRLAFFTVVGIFGIAALLGGRVTVPRALALGLATVIALVLTYLFAKDLPLAFQRAVSFLPGIDIDPVAAKDAIETVDWRLEVWRRAIEEVPEYLVIGKGFTFSVSAFLLGQVSNVDWALLNSTYHNGPLSALILTGIPGLLLLLAVQVVALVRHFRLQASPWQRPALKRFHLAFLAYLIVEVVVFWVFYGDIATSSLILFRQVALLEGVVASERLLAGREPVYEVHKDPNVLRGEVFEAVPRVYPKPRVRQVRAE